MVYVMGGPCHRPAFESSQQLRCNSSSWQLEKVPPTPHKPPALGSPYYATCSQARRRVPDAYVTVRRAPRRAQQPAPGTCGAGVGTTCAGAGARARAPCAVAGGSEPLAAPGSAGVQSEELGFLVWLAETEASCRWPAVPTVAPDLGGAGRSFGEALETTGEVQIPAGCASIGVQCNGRMSIGIQCVGRASLDANGAPPPVSTHTADDQPASQSALAQTDAAIATTCSQGAVADVTLNAGALADVRPTQTSAKKRTKRLASILRPHGRPASLLGASDYKAGEGCEQNSQSDASSDEEAADSDARHDGFILPDGDDVHGNPDGFSEVCDFEPRHETLEDADLAGLSFLSFDSSRQDDTLTGESFTQREVGRDESQSSLSAPSVPKSQLRPKSAAALAQALSRAVAEQLAVSTGTSSDAAAACLRQIAGRADRLFALRAACAGGAPAEAARKARAGGDRARQLQALERLETELRAELAAADERVAALRSSKEELAASKPEPHRDLLEKVRATAASMHRSDCDAEAAGVCSELEQCLGRLALIESWQRRGAQRRLEDAQQGLAKRAGDVAARAFADLPGRSLAPQCALLRLP
eukprot:TRINITY_DN17317_c0_g3_i1.p1 TRINITY_DN17317_c0_g3~~TRINITY_DN17317_c0_g3_i1.p1  ORF type:complete len:589 (+),score=93.44 TRINITY_DN17317_c0_g3_i1:90-1856(+)